MAACELAVVLLECEEAEVDVGVEKVGALGEQPDELVARDVGLARREHRLHLLEVLAAPPGAPWLHELPEGAVRSIAPLDAEAVVAGSSRPPLSGCRHRSHRSSRMPAGCHG